MAEDFGTVASGLVVKGVPILVGGIIVIIVLVAAIVISIWLYKRRKWNLEGDAVLLRTGMSDQYEDKCKGYWDAENGWIVLKRRGYREVHTKPFDPKEWLTGRNRFKVIQTGPEEFVIARVEWNRVIDSNTGEETFISKVIADVGKRKTWKNYTERMGKKTFTIQGWMQEHQMAITLAIVIFAIFMGFAILWMRMPSICPGAA
jgi:hypothetical protein